MPEALTTKTRNLSQADIQRAAAMLGVPVAIVQAINEVESQGTGFLLDGQPKILYERHVMYRLLKQVGKDADALAQQYPQLVNPMPGGYLGGEREHERLAQAKTIDKDCAIGACSWGRFQIMGYHWRRLGYPSATEFANLMAENEFNQLDAFVAYLLADPKAMAALQAKNWAMFARLYNGPAYQKNHYDDKLARAYAKFSVINPA
ncbi:N-acetylmuramidase family protein [Chitinimonas sp. PSY-7]|uniref:N-acetylmuramidase domain-containing protein n=1 Tax=Chitinimonas sp. PSY-7 TaxID=3459088 RepID=UPI00403FDB07